MADLEPRIAEVEAGIGEIRAILARIEERLAATATREQIENLQAEIFGEIAAVRIGFGELRRHLRG
jgi:putative component of toxin-antitoxin plasmid stabilization module